MVTLQSGLVTEASNVWVGIDTEGKFYRHQEEALISSTITDSVLVRDVYMAFNKSWKQVQTQLSGNAAAAHAKVELWYDNVVFERAAASDSSQPPQLNSSLFA